MRRMKRKRYIVPMLLVAISLIVFNLGMSRDRDRDRDSREISEYEYLRLHSVASVDSEVAQKVSQEFKQERITRAQYKKMMLRFEAMRNKTQHATPGQVAASLSP